MCAFKTKYGAPSPCFPIKGGRGAPVLVLHHFGGETLAPPSSPSLSCASILHVCVRVLMCLSLLECLQVRGARAPRLLGVRVLMLSNRRSMLVFFNSCRLRLRLHVRSVVRCSLLDYIFLPHPTRSFHIFFFPSYSCSSLCFARVSTIVIS